MLVAKGLFEARAENDSHILYGVVVIHFYITLGVDLQVAEAMPCEEGQHVIQKRDARVDSGFTGAVDNEFRRYSGLGGLAGLR